jgi:Cys-tRNA(Pro)/Cys-tRNA(Cys) deacylase
LVAGDAELHLKKLAALAGGRKAELMPLANVEPVTGYIRGGVTVLGAKKSFPVFADSSLLEHNIISVSAGTRGTQLLLTPQDYLSALERSLGAPAVLGDISRPLSAGVTA